jgi:extradiol dioxygenase family protein
MDPTARPGAVHWIDHFAVGSHDLDRWLDFMQQVVGARNWVEVGSPTRRIAVFQKITKYCGQDCFPQRAPLPPSKGLGKGCPRFGYYVRQEELDTHLRRLDRLGVPHSEPLRTSAEGEEGITIYWEDPDQNQYEFWAPRRLPDGAMADCGPLNVGRISHGVFECRDLERTTDYVARVFGLDPILNADVAADTRAFAMFGGGRLVYKQVDQLGERAPGGGKVRGPHAALVVQHDQFLPAYKRIYEFLPEEDDCDAAAPPDTLPPRTGTHGSLAGRQWKESGGRGDELYDWDLNKFHFVGGRPYNGSLATYRARYMDHYVADVLGIPGTSELFQVMVEEDARGDY